MNRVYVFTEQPYPDAWTASEDSLRVTLPNVHCDPDKMATLYHRHYDEWSLADELGLNVMTNEHHATATCAVPAITVPLSILARITRRARILALGVPLPHRSDPLRIAEELAMIDVISRGRLDMGFVKGVPYEIGPSNANPVNMMERFWESHDLILQAMSTRTGPFNFEGKYFNYRNVNLWPQPYQQPHPPVWSTTSSVPNVRAFAERGISIGTVLGGVVNCRAVFNEYRRVAKEIGQPGNPADRLAYMALCAIGSNEAEVRERAEKIVGYLRTTAIVAEPFRNPPGFASVEDNAKGLRGGMRARLFDRAGKPLDYKTASVQDLMDTGFLFAGTPDQVYRQMTEFNQAVGGYHNILLMTHAGTLTHQETVSSLTLLGKEILPRLQEFKVSEDTLAA